MRRRILQYLILRFRISSLMLASNVLSLHLNKYPVNVLAIDSDKYLFNINNTSARWLSNTEFDRLAHILAML